MAATTPLYDELCVNNSSNISGTRQCCNLSEELCRADNVLEDEFNPFIMPIWRQSIWIVIYAGLVLVATGGNLIVIWIVLAHRQMRTITNFFLVNLAVSDFLMSSMGTTFNFVYFLNSHWPFGQAYCKIVQFVSVLSVSASIFTLVAISIDRYFAIMHPLRPRMSRRRVLFATIAIWFWSGVLATPMYNVSETWTFVYQDGNIRTLCYCTWPDGETMDSTIETVFNAIVFVLTYALPLLVTGFCYLRMSTELWGSQSIGEATPVQIESVNSKRRVVRMMIVLVAIFAVCWAPYQCYFLVIPVWPEMTKKPLIQELFLGIYWLAMSNSMYNPLIYYWMNARFRTGFKQVMRCRGRMPSGEAGVLYRGNHRATTRITLADFSDKGSVNGTSSTRGGKALNGVENHV